MKMQDEMISKIRWHAQSASKHTGQKVLAERVLEVMSTVDRREFVPDISQRNAYEDCPLSIGSNQTISQPFIVALMTDLLDPKPEDHVLEIGTGSGYQAAVLAGLVSAVYSIEIIESLGLSAKERLQHLGYTNVFTTVEDGYYGWIDEAPFDSIIVTAAGPSLPEELLEQLKPGGRMVIPIVDSTFNQELLLVKKSATGTYTVTSKLPVRFVPLTGKHDSKS